MAMEFLRSAKRRSFVSELVYILLNVGLAVAILVVVWAVESPLPAFALVLLSKWRVLAVRPRYWFAHVQANMVDLIVSIGFVVLLYVVGHSGAQSTDSIVITQIVLALLYIGWLLALKPRAKRLYVIIQAGVAIGVGTTALFSLSYNWPSSLVVVIMALIGYASARHVLSAYDDNDVTLLSLVWGFVFAGLGWLAFHWTAAYTIVPTTAIKLPQITLVTIMLSFLAERVYGSFAVHGVVRRSDVMLPALLVFATITVIYILFLFDSHATGNI